ncbi:hypothetical protein [Sphingopyxis sp.]|uniref:hypothetical protein n=1 Tax=Sphingopyxis sp. TaxID=1908224 RepID=UPI0025FEB652|nr:hypothetical protein [Sphingopyxis sp.]MBK6414144.1 hypothetical protein [Sphingopyxis sp.]
MKRPGPWQDLPHGGAMCCECGIPFAVADKGAWQLDENRILEGAKEISGVKLTWLHLNRAKRWHKAPLTSALRPGGVWTWCIAEVAPAACDSCGVVAGVRWVGESAAPDRIWACNACADRAVSDQSALQHEP